MPPAAVLWFDYVDPLSRVLDARLRELEEGATVERRPLELRPPPAPLLDPAGAHWAGRMTRAAALSDPSLPPLAPPRLVPWSRKAHELALEAREAGCFDAIHQALFAAFFDEGRDIGRVDVLVELAVRHGMDRTRTKAVLDVDRHAAAVAEARRDAERRGIRGVPTLLSGDRLLEGLPERAALRAFLRRAESAGPDR